MKRICLNLNLHQPFRLKRYRFFDIGNDHYYFDDFQNEEVFRLLAEESYLPALRTIRDLIIQDRVPFRFSISISGTAFEQIELYAPELLDLLLDINSTGQIEFIAAPYSYSLSSLGDTAEFEREVGVLSKKIELLFGVSPRVLRNTELIYSDDIALTAQKMGFKAMMTEGAKHVLGWKSPNYLYSSAEAPELKLMLRNASYSSDLVRHFSNLHWSEYPLTTEKLAGWFANLPEVESFVYIDIPLETFGHIHKRPSGIFEFLKALPTTLESRGISMALPSEILQQEEVAAPLSVPSPISWSEEEKGITSWLGNVLQQEAFRKLGEWGERLRLSTDRRLFLDWLHLQSCDHFFYMTTLYQDVRPFSPYDNAYDAFNNYMNVLSDVVLRIQAQYPTSIENEELSALVLTIQNQDKQIVALEKELSELKAKKKTTKKSTKAAE
ncbi:MULTISPECIES: glycoside hydrolase family 57 protein [Porphyromonas]|uniref:glycoside hydrolase family 57 protein n=1 Tax=Porphyromonas TaxID=836 RepID=UPI00051D27A9|nr:MULTISPECIES: glycoside hydrolase family 57 protein [Porphyromonas]KGL52329.1 alpha-amylase [Porphyromonas canoris]KGN70476.1 alpha-amylase [Porphyromonas sp. COT-108 OH1349]KGN96426.1 alpha-amylase [Porphyromonas sp. COT-108 OH2963]